MRADYAGARANIRFKFLGHGHETPLAANLLEAAQRELTEPERKFDDAEHRFWRVFVQGVERSAPRRLQPMRHRLDRRQVFRRFGRRREALAQRRVMRLSAHRDHRLDARLFASLDIGRAEITRVRQQMFDLAQGLGQRRDLFQHRFDLVLVVGRRDHVSRNQGCPPPPPPARCSIGPSRRRPPA